MDDQETRETQDSQVEPESYTSGGVTYVGPARSRYGRLQEALDEFRQQADWLSGYLFVVGEHFDGGGDGGDIPERAVISYLDAVPGVAHDVGEALADVERLAAELRRVIGGEEPGGHCQTRRRAGLTALSGADEGRERNYRRGYLHGWLSGLNAMRMLLRAGRAARDAYRACADFARGELSEWRLGDCSRLDAPPTLGKKAGRAGGGLGLPS